MGLMKFNLPRKILLAAVVLLALLEILPDSFVSVADAAKDLGPVRDCLDNTTLSSPGWDSCNEAYLANVEASCGVAYGKAGMDSRDRAKVPKNAVGRWFLKGPRDTSVGGSLMDAREDASQALDDFRGNNFTWRTLFDWNAVHKYVFWADFLIAIGIVLLIDLLVHITPVLMCSCCRRCCCRRAYERRRSHGTCMMVTVIVCLVLAAFFIVISILYSVWVQSDMAGLQCSPQVDLYEIAFAGKTVDGKRFQGLKGVYYSTDKYREDLRDIESAVMDLGWYGAMPLAALVETSDWLGPAGGKQLWVVGDETKPGASLCHEIQNIPITIPTMADFNFGEPNAIRDKFKSAESAVNDTQAGVLDFYRVLNDEVYYDAAESFLNPLRNGEQGVDLAWIGLLVFSCLPVIGLVAAIVFFVYYRVQEDHTQLRRTGCSRRMAAFFIWGYAFWAWILFITCGALLAGLYFPSDACHWFEQRMKQGDYTDKFPGVNLDDIADGVINTCLMEGGNGDLLEAYNVTPALFNVEMDNSAINSVLTDVGNYVTPIPDDAIWQVVGRDTLFAAPSLARDFHMHPITVTDAGIDFVDLESSWNDTWVGILDTAAAPDCNPTNLCIQGLVWTSGTCGVTIDYTSVERDVLWGPEEFVGDNGLAHLKDPVKTWVTTCVPDPNNRAAAEENIYVAVLKSIIVGGGSPLGDNNEPPSGCENVQGPCYPTLLFDAGQGSPVNVSYVEWAQGGIGNVKEVAANAASYNETVWGLLDKQPRSPVRLAKDLIRNISDDNNCRPIFGVIEHVRDRVCNGLFGGLAVIFYCFLALAFLHVLAWAVLLHYWKARQTYVDALKEGEPVDEAPVARVRTVPGISEDAFLLAAERGQMSDVKLGCKTYEPNTVRDLFYSNSPLHLAAFYGHEEIVDYLLKQGYDPNALNYHFYTPFAACCSNRELLWPSKGNILINLRDHGAQTEIYDYQGDTPLVAATRARDHQTVKCLLDLGANPLCKDSILLQDSVTIAETKHDAELVRLLSAASPNHAPQMGLYDIPSPRTQ